MSEEQLRFRHSFQDFHTGPDIPDVGGRFDPDEFIATLEKARVNSVTLCARCHHGHLYYDSKVHPQLIHPNLARPNLLLEQIEACQKTTSRNHLHHGRVRLSHDPGAPRMGLAINADGSPHSLTPRASPVRYRRPGVIFTPSRVRRASSSSASICWRWAPNRRRANSHIPAASCARRTYDLIGSVLFADRGGRAVVTDVRAVTDGPVAAAGPIRSGRVCRLSRRHRRLRADAAGKGPQQFDILDPESDLAGYKLLILPDQVAVTRQLLPRSSSLSLRAGR